MSCLTWNCDKSFIYVIVYWVLELIHLGLFFEKEEFLQITESIVYDEYILIILLNIADLLSGFLVLYMKCSSKPKNIDNDNKKSERTESQSPQSEVELIYVKSVITLNKNFYIKLVIITILDYISRSSFWMSYAITKANPKKVSHTLQKNITITLDIIMRYIFSVFILKIIVYKHRIFSMFIISIGFAILIINDIILMIFNPKDYNINQAFFFLGIASISGFIYPLEDTFVKQIFTQNCLYPANMQFIRGLTEFILLIVITPILYFSFGGGLKFKPDLNLVKIIIALIIYTIVAFVKAFILLKIIYRYSSQSVSFLIIFQSFGGSVNRFIQIIKDGIIKDGGWKIVLILLEIIGILIILFACLIYDEIIIINKWGLNTNVKKGIINRGELEMKNMFVLRETQAEEQLIDNKNNERTSENKIHDENNDNEMYE